MLAVLVIVCSRDIKSYAKHTRQALQLHKALHLACICLCTLPCSCICNLAQHSRFAYTPFHACKALAM